VCYRSDYFRALCMGGLSETNQSVITIHDGEYVVSALDELMMVT